MGRIAILALALLAAGCGGEDAPDDAALYTTDADPSDDAPTVDSTLVDLLVDLHLADARGHDDDAAADSLRQLVYRLHATDSTRLQERLDELTSEPGAALDLAEAVETELSNERNGVDR